MHSPLWSRLFAVAARLRCARGLLCLAGSLCLTGTPCLPTPAFAQPPIPPAPAASEFPGSATGDRESALTATEALLRDRPIGNLQASIAPPTAAAPENLAREALELEGALPQPLGLGRGWCLQPLAWEASAVRHRPTYFEEPNLERLGYYYGVPHDGQVCYRVFGPVGEWLGSPYDADDYRPQNQVLQPVVSALNFYGRVAVLPYLVGATDPREEVYGLGEDRPGSPVPYRKYHMPLSARGILYQGAAATGMAFLIP